MEKKKSENFTEKLKRVLHKDLNRYMPLFHIAVAVLVIVFVLVMTGSNLVQNVETRAIAELQSTVDMQASASEDHLDEQYEALNLVADMLANGRHFHSNRIKPTLNSIVRTFRLCTLCLADTDGNATDYQGNVLGNCSDRSYFSKIMNGDSERFCEYLATTKETNEPRVIFSVPAYDENGDMLGVLFCSKEISVLEDSLFMHDTLFDSTAGIFICESSGNLIAANENAYDYFSENGETNENGLNIFSLSDEISDLKNSGGSEQIDINGIHCFAAYRQLDVNDWGIYCLLDEQNATATYQENQNRTEKTIEAIVLVFLAAIAYIIILGWINIRQKKREADTTKRYIENFKNILGETHCAVVEYDIEAKRIITIQENFGNLKLASLDGSMDAYENYKHVHPEFDFEELESEIDIAKKKGESCSFETIFAPDSSSLYWLKAKLIPITNEDGKITKIYCVLFDVSDMHKAHETELDTYSQIPGAVHRCVLSKPIHMNYYSDGLCKMLGYSHSEIDAIIGPDYKYSMLICEEDRPKFKEFIDGLSKNEGTQTCEYRMVTKDGTLLEVSDTMDAKLSSSGIMYGYSVVMDIRKYREEQKLLERELQKTRDQLAQIRVKNAGSQMQPHFLYNALSSIREIVLEDPEYASDLIYDFTTHLRACVRSMSSDALVTFSQELENIKAYVNIEKMRFGDRLQVEYDCPETEFEIIPLSIQPLVENAVRHGIFNRGPKGGRVVVSTSKSDEYIFVRVEDNGVGFDYEETMKEIEDGTRDSSGLKNLIFRFKTLMNAEVIVDSSKDFGTRITVEIPINE